jgi:hypothetical protein
MKFEIRHARNGVVLRIESEDHGGEPEEVVYQESESGNIEAFADFLRFLLDNYGPHTSRYSPQRIHVVIEPGDKYVPPTSRESHPKQGGLK